MNKKIGKNYIFLRKFCKKLYNLSENMAKIDALFTKSLTFLRFILNLPPPLAPESLKIYTHAILCKIREIPDLEKMHFEKFKFSFQKYLKFSELY